MEFSKHNWATISETICPEMLIFGPLVSIILCLTSPKLYLATFKLFLFKMIGLAGKFWLLISNLSNTIRGNAKNSQLVGI